VAGSTWPADDARLFPAWDRVRATNPDARLVLAPHEPTPAHLATAVRWAAAKGLRMARLGDPHVGGADVVLVDRLGVLGDLYAVAQAAYVGGGFHRAGLHSVLEPAAFGAPVLFGPGRRGNRDAALLQAAGGGVAVPDADALAAVLATWLADATVRRLAGARARAVVEAGLGAAERSFALVDDLLGGGS
jgi:3-deoxy-D-manno-octulosonic-acid transferase